VIAVPWTGLKIGLKRSKRLGSPSASRYLAEPKRCAKQASFSHIVSGRQGASRYCLPLDFLDQRSRRWKL